MKKMIDVISGKEKIKVDEVNATTINAPYFSISRPIKISLGENTLNFEVISKAIFFNTEDHGSAYITDEGFVIDCLGGLTIVDGILYLPMHTTALRPTEAYEGGIIYDSTLKKCILYNGTAWVNLDGTALS